MRVHTNIISAYDSCIQSSSTAYACNINSASAAVAGRLRRRVFAQYLCSHNIRAGRTTRANTHTYANMHSAAQRVSFHACAAAVGARRRVVSYVLLRCTTPRICSESICGGAGWRRRAQMKIETIIQMLHALYTCYSTSAPPPVPYKMCNNLLWPQWAANNKYRNMEINHPSSQSAYQYVCYACECVCC